MSADGLPSTPPTTSRLQWLGFAGLFGGIVAVVLLAASFVAPAPACACSPTAPPPASPVVGVVIDITSAGLGQVEWFTLRRSDGTTIELTMGTLENAVDFPPAHLAEHRASSSPVRAFFRVGAAGDLEVYRLEDATEP